MARFYEVAAYSFADVTLAVAGPNNLHAYITGEAEEGFSIEFEGQKNTMMVGAGGDVMHSLRVAQPGRLLIRVLKTSSSNKLLSDAWIYQVGSAATHGKMTWTVTDASNVDLWVLTGVAFNNHTNGAWATVGNAQEWTLDCARISPKLGAGTDLTLTT